jgi:23S rRNA pseudouridine2605 synthase
VLNLFPNEKRRLFTVGRLDRDSIGLILVTNDGDFSNRIIHPSYGIQKEYLVKVNREVTHDHLVRMSEGIEIEDAFVKPIRVRKVRRGTIKVTVAEGKKHEVRLLVSAAGLEVKELKRIRIGDLHLGMLPTGNWRPLTKKEYNLLMGEK